MEIPDRDASGGAWPASVRKVEAASIKLTKECGGDAAPEAEKLI